MAITTIETSSLRRDLPLIHAGDMVRVHQKIREGDKERINVFEGLVIACKHGAGISGMFTVRKTVEGIGVERVFPLHSPRIVKVQIVRRAKVRRSKLYYIRDKAAREVRRKMKQITSEIGKGDRKIVLPETESAEVEVVA